MQTITIHGRQPLHGSIRPAAAKTAPCRCWRRHCSAAGRAVCAACPPWPMLTPAWPFCRLWGPTRSAAARISAPARRCSLRRDSRLPGRGHAQLGVLFGAAALPGGVCAAAPAGRLPPGAASCGYPPGRVGLHGGRGRIRGHRRDAAAQRGRCMGWISRCGCPASVLQ